jgi:phosphoglycolate phosphatase
MRPMASDGARRQFRLIVFDWDGTLVDSTAIIARAIQLACRDVGEPVPDDARARYVIGLGLADALRHVAPGLPHERHGELASAYRKHYLGQEGAIPLFAGAADLLCELQAAGHLLAIATGKTRKGLDRALAQQGVAHRFVASRCADEGPPKPDPAMLRHLMERVGASRDETLMIGDTTHDLDLAQRAGASSVAVAYGAHAADGFARFAPLATVHSVAELGEWLRANA